MISSSRSTAVRPASSSRFEPSRFEALLQPPSPRQQRGNTTRNTQSRSLRLPALPRFHPANFPSSSSSYQSTPEDESKAPLSPRTHQRMYSEAQKQLLMHHRESVAAARTSSPFVEKPVSPRLLPLGSPGPVTPLELETEGGYLVAGVKTPAVMPRPELIESLIQKELRQPTRRSYNNSSAP